MFDIFKQTIRQIIKKYFPSDWVAFFFLLLLFLPLLRLNCQSDRATCDKRRTIKPETRTTERSRNDEKTVATHTSAMLSQLRTYLRMLDEMSE